MKKWLVFFVVLAVYAAHQDYWNFKDKETLYFGFLPVGLAYHACYSIACAGLMWFLVKTVWPAHLEDVQPETDAPQGESH